MGTWKISFPSSPGTISQVRRQVKDFARTWFGEAELIDIEIAVGEALANSVEHGHASWIKVNCRVEASELIIEIADNGLGFTIGKRDDAGAVDSRGRGIALMYSAMDRVEFGDHGRRVRLIKRLPRAPAGESTAGEIA